MALPSLKINWYHWCMSNVSIHKRQVGWKLLRLIDAQWPRSIEKSHKARSIGVQSAFNFGIPLYFSLFLLYTRYLLPCELTRRMLVGHLQDVEEKVRLMITAPYCKNASALRSALAAQARPLLCSLNCLVVTLTLTLTL